MDTVIHPPLYAAWALTLFLSLVSLLKWKVRRAVAERRINRGLRAYTAGSHLVS